MSLCVTLKSPSARAKEKVFLSQFFRRKCNVTHWDTESALLRVTELSDGFRKLVWRKKANQDTSLGFPLLCCDFKPVWFTCVRDKYIYLLWQNTFWKSWRDLPARDKNHVFIFEMRKNVELQSSCQNFIVQSSLFFIFNCTWIRRQKEKTECRWVPLWHHKGTRSYSILWKVERPDEVFLTSHYSRYPQRAIGTIDLKYYFTKKTPDKSSKSFCLTIWK